MNSSCYDILNNRLCYHTHGTCACSSASPAHWPCFQLNQSIAGSFLTYNFHPLTTHPHHMTPPHTHTHTPTQSPEGGACRHIEQVSHPTTTDHPNFPAVIVVFTTLFPAQLPTLISCCHSNPNNTLTQLYFMNKLIKQSLMLLSTVREFLS